MCCTRNPPPAVRAGGGPTLLPANWLRKVRGQDGARTARREHAVVPGNANYKDTGYPNGPANNGRPRTDLQLLLTSQVAAAPFESAPG